MKYLQFHDHCLQALIDYEPCESSDMIMTLCGGTQLRVQAPSMSLPMKCYFEQYNNLKPNEKRSTGIIIDRFISVHVTEERYAQDDWDNFNIKTHFIKTKVPFALKQMMKFQFEHVKPQLLEQIFKMHTDKKIECNTFNPYGGERYNYEYVTFKDIHTSLINQSAI